MNDSYFLRNEACPKCRGMGKDIQGDNLAVWSDGRVSCWSCGFFRLPSLNLGRRVHTNTKLPDITLPNDADTEYPNKALEWIGQYDINRIDLLKHGVLWSEGGSYINLKGEKVQCTQQLIFPYWHDGELLGYQGRYFGGHVGVPKWITRGKLDKVYHILPGKQPLIIVESVISAMKLSKYGYSSMPIFGNKVKNRYKPLRILSHSEVILWLDPDMGMQMVKQSRIGALEGFETRCILSSKKPKDCTREEIGEYLDG